MGALETITYELARSALELAGLSALAISAMVAFACSVLVSVYALMPRRGLTFAIGGTAVHRQRAAHGEFDEGALLRDLTASLIASHAANQRLIDRISRAFTVAGACLGAEVILFGLQLAVT